MNRARAVMVHRTFLVTVAAVALALASLPFILGSRLSPPGATFFSIPPNNSADALEYLALSAEVSRGHLLLGDPFTTEMVPRRLFHPVALAQGALHAVTGDATLAAHVMRLAGGIALLAAGWAFIVVLVPTWRVRRLAMLLFCLGSGGTFWAQRLGVAAWGTDAVQPESNTFFMLGNLAHLSLSAAAVTCIAAVGASRRPWTSRDGRVVVLGSAFLSLVHPFDFLVLALAAGGWRVVAGPQPRLRQVLAHAVVGAAPGGLYLASLVATEPTWRALTSDSLVVDHWWVYALGLGPLVVAGTGLALDRERARRLALAWAWVVAILLFLLLPVPLGGKQPRLVGAIHAPLAVLAASGLDAWARWAVGGLVGLRARSVRRHAWDVFVAAGVMFLCMGSAGRVESDLAFIARGGPDHHHPADLRSLLAELSARAEAGDVVLGGVVTGGLAPVAAPVVSYVGHWHMTLEEPRKRVEVRRFFVEADARARRGFLAEHRVRWVLFFPDEWVILGHGPPRPIEDGAGMQLEWSAPRAALYRVGNPSAGP